jgi:hypothetical protein
MLRGGVGFGGVSLAGFSVWAFGGKWLQSNLGEAGLYGVCSLVFLGSSGLLLHSLVQGPGPMLRFYKVFIPAFLAYAITWCAAWFLLRFGSGEWLGSLFGSLIFVAGLGWGFGNYRGFLKASVVLFGLHSAGYFLGGQSMRWISGTEGAALFEGASKAQISILAKLSWGLLYGLGFGAGIGYAFNILQREREAAPTASE